MLFPLNRLTISDIYDSRAHLSSTLNYRWWNTFKWFTRKTSGNNFTHLKPKFTTEPSEMNSASCYDCWELSESLRSFLVSLLLLLAFHMSRGPPLLWCWRALWMLASRRMRQVRRKLIWVFHCVKLRGSGQFVDKGNGNRRSGRWREGGVLQWRREWIIVRRSIVI